MFDPLYDHVAGDSGVQAALGNPVRVYSFGDAPANKETAYAVHQVVGGLPENYLSGRPDADGLSVQVDVYGPTVAGVKAAVRALLAALEEIAHVTSWNGEFRDLETKLWRISFTVEFKDSR